MMRTSGSKPRLLDLILLNLRVRWPTGAAIVKPSNTEYTQRYRNLLGKVTKKSENNITAVWLWIRSWKFFHSMIFAIFSKYLSTETLIIKSQSCDKFPVFVMFACFPFIWNHLTGDNWQKWKRVFLTCSCHEIYRDEAVSLKSCKNTWKITIFVKMWNLGQNRENLIFCQ